MPGFEGLSILITGAASGLGRALSLRLAEAGGRLTLGDIAEAGLAETAEACRAKGADVAVRRTDVAEEADAAALVDLALSAHGGLNIAYNNAGVAHDLGKLAEQPYAVFQRQMAVNAGGVFLGMKHQIPAMLAGDGGAICNTASVAGVVSAPLLAPYGAAKHAVVGMTKAAAEEYARRNIRINAVCPAFTDTPMLEEIGAQTGPDARDTGYARLTGRIPMGRVGDTEEIITAMLFAGHPDNTFMTGQTLHIDGGLTAI